MSLLVKVNMALLAIFAVAMAGVYSFASAVLQDAAKWEINNQASLMMEAAKAARTYTATEIKPLLVQQLEKDFIAQSVPSYAATQSFLKLRETHPDYTYKEATLNPTNLRDRVVEWESDLVQQFRNHPETKELTGERMTPTGLSMYLARPIKVTDAACLACHSVPSVAPAPLIKTYGAEHGFGWQFNEIVGTQIVSVPASAAYEQAQKTIRLLMTGVGLTFLVILLLVNLVIGLLVIRPVRKIAQIANDISEGKPDVEAFKLRGSDEIAVLSMAFNRMRLSLEKAMEMLH
ncbi:MAG: DUF3365 domain-containing protein [Burkholderiaceae bacterium]|nr:DUF3365 domain-containing protein [Roseateles sp.]MBV8469071.1 DUF3365 domain-containing protein [Burkholderiaceae bacterium]